MSEQRFIQNEFGEEKIEHKSRFFDQEVDSRTPSFLNGYLSANVLNDETDYLQVGQSENHEYY